MNLAESLNFANFVISTDNTDEMKQKQLIFSAALALVLTACGGNSKTSDSTVDSSEILRADSAAAIDAANADSAAHADSVARVIEEAKAEARESKDNALDAKVDKIVGMIDRTTDAVDDLRKNGFPSSSSTAFRVLEGLPDWQSEYNKIKGQLSAEQKARINAAQKRLDRASDKWDEATEDMFNNM